MSSNVKPYSWIVRFDVAPMWVADGFNLSDERALSMLGKTLGYACMSSELAARVLAGPSALRVAREMGYGANHPASKREINNITAAAPHAYAAMTKNAEVVTLDRALMDAINLLDSVAFVREEGDNTAQVIKNLRKAQAMVRGDAAISDIEWFPAED